MDPLGVIGIIVSLAIAYWQHRKAKAADARLERYLETLPTQLIENVTRFLQEHRKDEISVRELASSNKRVVSSYADIDGDGEEELLVQFPYGTHGSALQIYGMKDWDFKLLGELSTDTPFGFDVEDMDGNGVPELRVIETNASSGLPYVMGLRDVVWYRFSNGSFTEIKREEPDADEIEERRRELDAGFSQSLVE